jgi:hypothetical protein
MAMAKNLLAAGAGAGEPQLAAEMRQKPRRCSTACATRNWRTIWRNTMAGRGYTNIEQALLDRALDDAVAGIDHAPDAATGHANLKNVIQRLYRNGPLRGSGAIGVPSMTR